MTDFFHDKLAATDPAVAKIIDNELKRQQDAIELIASENIVSQAVLDAAGSIFTNKYSEGYPGKRYYQGNQFADDMESLCIARACEIFGTKYANVQTHAGAPANLAVLFALAKPGDTIMGMNLAAGGHLTHGAKPTISGRWFNSVQYGVDENGMIDYDEVERMAVENKPKFIIAGATAYPRLFDFKRFREIADKAGAKFMVDMAHIAGLVAAKVIPSPVEYADVITATTHKTLRGPRGGLILTNDEEMAKKIDRAVFPGIQGGPLDHVIAAKAVAFGEILKPTWKPYAEQIVKNAKVLGEELIKHGFKLISGGTDTHLLLVDLRPKGITGTEADTALEHAGITTNKNAIPNDPLPPTITSGIRIGTPAITTRGMKEAEMVEIASLMNRAIEDYVVGKNYESEGIKAVRADALKLVRRFPIY
ncbi:MAG: serine hydroxymethyltransferase [Alphaproteobacteria bacterium]|nr:serine hydroxymethyltransferase [Alphaproteobacteria bacterium]